MSYIYSCNNLALKMSQAAVVVFMTFTNDNCYLFINLSDLIWSILCYF